MNMDELLDKDYILPEEGEPAYRKFVVQNKFLYSGVIEILNNPDHEARNWILKEEVVNGSIKVYELLLRNYDSEMIQTSQIPTTMNKLVNTKLNKTSRGATKTFITNFATYLSLL